MADYSGIEKLLGLPIGSTEGPSQKVAPVLVKGIQNKTEQLVRRADQVTEMQALKPHELVQTGISLERVKQEKVWLLNELHNVYHISKNLLERYMSDIDKLVEVNDRMYASGAKLIESVTMSLEKLTSINKRLEQEEQFKAAATPDEEDEAKVMKPSDWMEFIKAAKHAASSENIPEANIID